MMKFDVVVGNPPYKGAAALHQQFFNFGADALKHNGHLVFIQPASPYQNNKKESSKREAELHMLENIRKYETSVKLIEPFCFLNALPFTDLAITHLTKVRGNGKIASLRYKDGNEYKDVKIENINIFGMKPNIFDRLSSKIDKQIAKRGCLADVLTYDEKSLKLRLQKVRGNMGTTDLQTFISRNSKYWNSKTDFGIALKDEKQRTNVVSYLKTYIARFALGRVKINQNMASGELKYVPLVDFDENWNDEKLMKEFGITQNEYKEIRRVIPKYYDDVG